MTENEALKRMKMCIGVSPSENIINSFKLMSDALDELQQYRAIGTVEHIKLTFELCNGLDCMVKMYEAIGTIEDFKALKEKSVAKKPHSISIADDIGNSMVECPICHARSDYDVKSIKSGHCWRCGQKLDWSE